MTIIRFSESQVAQLLGGRPWPAGRFARMLLAERIFDAFCKSHGRKAVHHASLLAGCFPDVVEDARRDFTHWWSIEGGDRSQLEELARQDMAAVAD